MSGEQQPALSAQAEEDAMRGRCWGADTQRTENLIIYYARKIRFRQEEPRPRKSNNARTAADAPGQETTEPEVDEHDSVTEGDTESDAKEGASLKRRNKKAGCSSDNKKHLELVRCCHCSKKRNWLLEESSRAPLLLKHSVDHTDNKQPGKMGVRRPGGSTTGRSQEGNHLQ
ncbi:hypothetical protein FN846DRAFT_894731 [Sphaerosporella brunnea]|uniref:Uncharacterized protein n=1 Tax=Sphaerosporella brunnea TaxID=1250544 RepID=A0A5J5EGI4_9PEZI|nr:hypothetical protein FN846DRAFT_894731 [Sphaerosporella brunnea]